MPAPVDIPGLGLWIDPATGSYQDSARTTPAVAGGDPFGGWTDQSGAGNHPAQATGGNRGTLQLAQKNGLPTWRGNGSASYLTTPALGWGANWSVFAVARGTAGSIWGANPASPSVNRCIYGAPTLLDMFAWDGTTGVPVSPEFGILGGEWLIVSAVVDSVGLRFGVNGRPVATATLANPAWHGSVPLYLSRDTSGNYLTGDLGTLVVCPALASTNPDRDAVVKYLSQRWDIGQVLWDGNSRIFGSGVTHDVNDLPTQTQALLLAAGHDWSKRNFGLNGQTIDQMVADVATQIDPLSGPTLRANVLFASEGINQISAGGGGSSPAVAFDKYASYCRARQYAGLKVVACTEISASLGNPATFDSVERLTYNALIRLYWPTFADALCDLGLDPQIGVPGSYLNTGLFIDSQHLNAAGTAIAAGRASTSILSLFATTSTSSGRRPRAQYAGI